MQEVTAIFDIGKTNKKLLIFNNDCKVVDEYSGSLPETTDEDGFACEDIYLLKEWIFKKWDELVCKGDYNITALNFAAYGASFVHLDQKGGPVTALYSYLKLYPPGLAEDLYLRYGGKWIFSAATRSPPMGMLNSGLQLLWLKYKNPDLFSRITTSLHLPQYLSFLFTGQFMSEYTSIGCHTALWEFAKHNYHPWVHDEGIGKVLAPLNSNPFVGELSVNNKKVAVGSGLHDSSAALIPYLKKNAQPFVLISTGTWCITLNPFNASALTQEELALDCLCYLTPDGKPIKASRIFLGKEHEFQSARIEKHFGKAKGYCGGIKFDMERVHALLQGNLVVRKLVPACMEGSGPFPKKPKNEWNLEQFSSCEEAYLQLMIDLTCMLKHSVQLVDSTNTETIFIEGGFGDNEIFMCLMANHFPGKKVKSSFLKQATALGAALHINPACEIKDWKFRSFEPSDVQHPLKDYYNRHWENNTA